MSYWFEVEVKVTERYLVETKDFDEDTAMDLVSDSLPIDVWDEMSVADVTCDYECLLEDTDESNIIRL